MSGLLIPNGKQTFLDQYGVPLAGGTVTFYVPGTTSPQDTYQDRDLTILNTNPVQLDAAGTAVIWGDVSYRQIVMDSNGVTVWDQITSAPGGSGGMTEFEELLAGPTGSSLVGYSPGASGSIVETVQDKLRQSV